MFSTISQKFRDSGFVSGLIALLAMSLPLSTSALSVLGLLLLLFWLAEGDYAGKFREILANPVMVAIFIYLMLYPVSLLWTSNLDNGLSIIEKQWKYLLLPVLFTSVRREHLRYYLGAFLGAMVFSALVSIFLWLGYYQARNGSPTDPTPFLDRIDYCPFLALGAYMLAEAAVHRLRGLRRWAAGGLALLLTIDLFLTQGRTGQIAFLALLIIWVFQFFPGRSLRAGLVSLPCLLLVLLGAYQLSPNFRARADQTVTDSHNFERKPETSVGQRMIFLLNSLEVAAAHPWLGTSPGDYQDEYRQVNQRRSPSFPATPDPHNQYLLVMTNFGVAGMLLFSLLFWRMARFIPAQPDDLGRLRIGFLVFFLTIMASGSYLTHFHAGFLFILGSVLLFKNHPRSVAVASS